MAPALALVLALAATQAAAETLLSPSEFEKLSTGSTMHFNRGGSWYGSEEYFSDRRVVWKYADGSCTWGEWYPKGEALCFTYEDNPTPQCWLFAQRDGSYFVRPQDEASGGVSELRLTQQSDKPLACNAPNLGT